MEFRPFIPFCRFPDCSHSHESDCAVKEAVHRGQIHPGRFESYLKLYEKSPSTRNDEHRGHAGTSPLRRQAACHKKRAARSARPARAALFKTLTLGRVQPTARNAMQDGGLHPPYGGSNPVVASRSLEQHLARLGLRNLRHHESKDPVSQRGVDFFGINLLGKRNRLFESAESPARVQILASFGFLPSPLIVKTPLWTVMSTSFSATPGSSASR